MGQFAIPVGHKRLFLFGGVVGERLDDDAEVGQTLIDIGGLLEPDPFSAGLGLPLRAREINNIDFTIPGLSDSLLLIIESENSMAPG
jgi:hypothetical protein